MPFVLPPIPRVASPDKDDLQTLPMTKAPQPPRDPPLPTPTAKRPSLRSRASDGRQSHNDCPVVRQPLASAVSEPALKIPQSSPIGLGSVSHAIAYSATTASRQPTLGDRPLKSTLTVNGVVVHGKTSSVSPEAAAKPPSRRGLSLLNPVNLLSRRRSAITTDVRQQDWTGPQSASSPLAASSPDYDPRIRGNVVHDFSAPRQPSISAATPVEVTHNDIDNSSQTKSASLTSPRLPEMNSMPEAERTSSQSNDSEWDSRLSNIFFDSRHHNNPPPHESVSPAGSFLTKSSAAHPQHEAPPAPASPAREVVSASDSVTTLPPSRLTSNGSRFSFQMAGQDAFLEERRLEEKAKNRRSDSMAAHQENNHEDEEYFDEDAMYDEDELETAYNVQPQPHVSDTETEALASQNAASPLTSQVMGLGIAAVGEADSSGFYMHAGSTVTTDTDEQYEKQATTQVEALSSGRSPRENAHMLLPRLQTDAQASHRSPERKPETLTDETAASTRRPSHADDDDMYYDDGMIETHQPTRSPGRQIDESSFDDPDFLRRDKNVKDVNDVNISSSAPRDSPLSAMVKGLSVSSPDTRPTTAYHDDDQAYQGALAAAAQKAAAHGKFDRTPSNVSGGSVYSEHPSMPTRSASINDTQAIDHNRQPDVPAGKHISRDRYSGFDFGFNQRHSAATSGQSLPLANSALSPVTDNIYDDDVYNNDDIISEANADALASDDEGFYGQEFGFYSRSRPGSAGSDAGNGGFYGQPGMDMIERKWSLREPNLTPITERSEFSTRNSVAGGPLSPVLGSLPGPNTVGHGHVSRLSEGTSLAQLQHEEQLHMDRMVQMRSMPHQSDMNGQQSRGVLAQSNPPPSQMHNQYMSPQQIHAMQTHPANAYSQFQQGPYMPQQMSYGNHYPQYNMHHAPQHAQNSYGMQQYSAGPGYGYHQNVPQYQQGHPSMYTQPLMTNIHLQQGTAPYAYANNAQSAHGHTSTDKENWPGSPNVASPDPYTTPRKTAVGPVSSPEAPLTAYKVGPSTAARSDGVYERATGRRNGVDVWT